MRRMFRAADGRLVKRREDPEALKHRADVFLCGILTEIACGILFVWASGILG